ncbi:MAG: tripartite tricarboxylate transporter substrate binding protein [Alphaproteobacteria bacterium]|nr:tripartite tricarboxylate transporter substrate binding protein [Alphaproteobacteria bacterium]
MRRTSLDCVRAFVLVVAATLLAGTAVAQDNFPNRALRIVVPFPPGGPNDVLARLVSDHLSKVWGQPAVVENRPGGGGNLAADLVVKAPADGYTLLIGATGIMAVNQFVYKNLPYSSSRDLVAATMLAHAPLILTVGTHVTATTLADYVAFVKANPGKRNWAHPGVGTSPQLAAATFVARAGLDMASIPYRGTTAIVDAQLKGEIDWTMDVMHSAIPLHRGGKVRALAVTAKQRWPLFPEIPSMAEAGYPDVDAAAWFCIAVHAGTPRPIVERLGAEIARGMKSEDSKQRLASFGMLDISGTPDEARRYIDAQIAYWRPIVEGLKITVE